MTSKLSLREVLVLTCWMVAKLNGQMPSQHQQNGGGQASSAGLSCTTGGGRRESSHKRPRLMSADAAMLDDAALVARMDKTNEKISALQSLMQTQLGDILTAVNQSSTKLLGRLEGLEESVAQLKAGKGHTPLSTDPSTASLFGCPASKTSGLSRVSSLGLGSDAFLGGLSDPQKLGRNTSVDYAQELWNNTKNTPEDEILRSTTGGEDDPLFPSLTNIGMDRTISWEPAGRVDPPKRENKATLSSSSSSSSSSLPSVSLAPPAPPPPPNAAMIPCVTRVTKQKQPAAVIVFDATEEQNNNRPSPSSLSSCSSGGGPIPLQDDSCYTSARTL
eukprot:CAMPEP_0185795118 /NCGR_PEP_ID=MMETSP1174-20130828/160378_1 /TAXON_ID=35687 /ORGANISM="Dictyocha speculum, Strain CCMP1381" /LENGTH=331 /DNA_ID=CAMNT_0028490393 /DNA_START=2179 /DNA_END=3175 /DNA_ORIENTATION=-